MEDEESNDQRASPNKINTVIKPIATVTRKFLITASIFLAAMVFVYLTSFKPCSYNFFLNFYNFVCKISANV